MKKDIIIANSATHHQFRSRRHVNVDCQSHLHFHLEIVLVTEGTLNMTVNHVEYAISAGSGIFIPPLTEHSFLSKEPNVCHVLMFFSELAPIFFEHYKKSLLSTYLFRIPEECQKLVDKHLPEESNYPDVLTAQAALSPLCAEIRDQCQIRADASYLDDQFLAALQYINEHFNEELSLKKVAQEVGLHPVTLSKKFSKHSTLSFSPYLNHLRCTHAATIIGNYQGTIAEAAFSVGFGSISSFNRAFFKTFGVTPSKFKENPQHITIL